MAVPPLSLPALQRNMLVLTVWFDGFAMITAVLVFRVSGIFKFVINDRRWMCNLPRRENRRMWGCRRIYLFVMVCLPWMPNESELTLAFAAV